MEYLTVKEYAQRMGLNAEYVRRCCRTGAIKAFRATDAPQAQWRIPWEEK